MQYDEEFKLQALELSDEIGVKAAAEQLGIKYYTLADWRSQLITERDLICSWGLSTSLETVRPRNLGLPNMQDMDLRIIR